MASNFYYQYQPLESERHIRLLQFHYGAGPIWRGWCRHGISFSLVHVSLDEAPKYEAVSYAWGHPARFEKLPMTNGDNLRITKSVFEAIPYLVCRSQTGFLWLDQVCINQDDKNERGHQVKLMKDVYRGAARTLIWLGLEDEDTGTAVQLIHDFYEQFCSVIERYGGTIASIWLRILKTEGVSGLNRKWAGGLVLDSIAKRPWFARGWVVQELVLSKSPVFLIGRYLLHWDPLRYTICGFWVYSPTQIHGNCNQISKLSNIPSDFRILANDKQSDAVDFLRLCRLFHSCSADFFTTDPKDRVFAYLGLLNLHTFEPDYRQSISNVYIGFTRHVVDVLGFVDILGACTSRCDAEIQEVDELPSWVPNFTKSPEIGSFLLDTPIEQPVKWNASAAKRHNNFKNTSSNELHIVGKVVDSVVKVAPEVLDVEWWFCHEKSGQDWVQKPEFLQMAIDIDGCGHPSSAHSFEDLLAWYEVFRGPGQPFADCESASIVQAWDNGYRHGVENYVDGIFGSFYGRSLIQTTSGRFGFCPHFTKPGDAIVIIHGALMPYVLRNTGTPSTYRLVGDCYINGIMFGEAVDWEDDEGDRIILI